MTGSSADRIYLDHAATTPLDSDVRRAMAGALETPFGNPSSVHTTGRGARALLDDMRRSVAGAFGAKPDEIVFTSGGTEANNLAIGGVARAHCSGHIAVSAIEHHAVLRSAWSLCDLGFSVSEIPVDVHGRISPEALVASLRPDTFMVSVGLANNEIGTLQDIPELARAAHDAGAVFHTDAVQAVGQVDINVGLLGVDLLSMSGHKINGPKGIGALYVRDGIELQPQALGGAQEVGRRAGTENVPAIVGLAHAVSKATRSWRETAGRFSEMSTVLIDQVLARAPNARLTGHPEFRLPSIVSLVFVNVDTESLLISLDLDGVEASSGAACEAGSIESSHVINALGFTQSDRVAPLRLSIGRDTTDDQIERAADIVVAHVNRLAGASNEAVIAVRQV